MASATRPGPYELTTSLSINGGEPEFLDDYAARLDTALLALIHFRDEVTAYFVSPNHESYEIEVGLRFEGMDPQKIEATASSILDEAIRDVLSAIGTPHVPVREESTLVPA